MHERAQERDARYNSAHAQLMHTKHLKQNSPIDNTIQHNTTQHTTRRVRERQREREREKERERGREREGEREREIGTLFREANYLAAW